MRGGRALVLKTRWKWRLTRVDGIWFSGALSGRVNGRAALRGRRCAGPRLPPATPPEAGLVCALWFQGRRCANRRRIVSIYTPARVSTVTSLLQSEAPVLLVARTR